MPDYLPKFTGPFTKVCSAAVTGRQMVVVSGNNTVAPSAAADAKWVGVAAHDQVAGQEVTIYHGDVQRPLASGAITAGDIVVTAAAGRVVTNAAPGAGQQVGIALTTATDGNPVEVLFNR
jgi:hypothetical protein